LKGTKPRVLVLRSSENLAETCAELRKASIECIPVEAIRAEAVAQEGRLMRSMIASADYVIFTSKNSIAFSKSYFSGVYAGHKFLTCGISTKTFAEESGFRVSYAPKTGGINAVIKWLKAKRPGPVLCISGESSSNDFLQVLLRGFTVIEVGVYRIKRLRPKIPAEAITGISHVLFFSSAEVDVFRDAVASHNGLDFDSVSAVCIGRKTFERAAAIFRKPVLSRQNGIAGAIEAIKNG
jgi:Uroporphyrinogen-III synthase